MADYFDEPIISTPIPDLIQVDSGTWIREFVLAIEDPARIPDVSDQESRHVTDCVIRLLKRGFADKYDWVQSLSPSELFVFLEHSGPNRLKVVLRTGKHSLSDPLFVFALMTTIRVMERRFGDIVGFWFNGQDHPDWSLWRMRKMYLGNLIDDEILEGELIAEC